MVLDDRSLPFYEILFIFISFFRTSGECAHVMAVVLKITDWLLEGLVEVPTQPSCTSELQRWDKPRGKKIMPEPVSTMVISQSTNVKRKKRPYTADFRDNRQN